MKTRFVTLISDQRNWLLVDAAGKHLGRLASQVAKLLSGKHKAIYTPHNDMGDFVVVINAANVVLTGRKEQNKTYYSHTGYPGGIKSITADKLRAKHPERLIEKAVRGMLPKGPLGRRMCTKLKIYASADHKHQAQMPVPFDETAKVH